MSLDTHIGFTGLQIGSLFTIKSLHFVRVAEITIWNGVYYTYLWSVLKKGLNKPSTSSKTIKEHHCEIPPGFLWTRKVFKHFHGNPLMRISCDVLHFVDLYSILHPFKDTPIQCIWKSYSMDIFKSFAIHFALSVSSYP